MTSNCNCDSTTRVHDVGCPANEANRELVSKNCSCGDIIVIPDYKYNSLHHADHAFFVTEIYSDCVELYTPHGFRARFFYSELSKAGAYHIWNRPVVEFLKS